MGADAWAAWAQWVTAAIAFGAAIFAYQQVKLARETRERVAQPDVVVYIERDPQNWHYMDFVVKNFGQTPAYNIQMTLPPLEVVPWENAVTGEQVTELWIPKSIAVLAPGQEWRTSWDSGIERAEYKGELKTQFVGRVDFDDKMNAGNHYSNPISLDANMFWNTLHVTTEKGRSTEKALYEIATTLKGYKGQHGGLWVYAVPGDDERQYHSNFIAAAKAQSARIGRRLRGEPEPPDVGGEQTAPVGEQ